MCCFDPVSMPSAYAWCELEIKEVGKSQWRASQQKIEPTTQVVEAHFGSKASAKAGHRMKSIGCLAKSQVQLAGNTFDHLANAVHPAPPAGRGLSDWLAIVRLSQYSRMSVVKPMQLQRLAGGGAVRHGGW